MLLRKGTRCCAWPTPPPATTSAVQTSARHTDIFFMRFVPTRTAKYLPLGGRRTAGAAVGDRRDSVGSGRVEGLERRAAGAARQHARSRSQEHLLRRRGPVEKHADEAVAHLVPVLGSPNNLLGSVGIEPVGRRVVEVGDQLQLRALG